MDVEYGVAYLWPTTKRRLDELNSGALSALDGVGDMERARALVYGEQTEASHE